MKVRDARELPVGVRFRLEQIGITTVEQLQATPDEKILKLRGVAEKTLKKIRTVAPYAPGTETVPDVPVNVDLAKRVKAELRSLEMAVFAEFFAKTGIDGVALDLWVRGLQEPSKEKIAAASNFFASKKGESVQQKWQNTKNKIIGDFITLLKDEVYDEVVHDILKYPPWNKEIEKEYQKLKAFQFSIKQDIFDLEQKITGNPSVCFADSSLYTKEPLDEAAK